MCYSPASKRIIFVGSYSSADVRPFRKSWPIFKNSYHLFYDYILHNFHNSVRFIPFKLRRRFGESRSIESFKQSSFKSITCQTSSFTSFGYFRKSILEMVCRSITPLSRGQCCWKSADFNFGN